jgi:hypothetical protein
MVRTSRGVDRLVLSLDAEWGGFGHVEAVLVNGVTEHVALNLTESEDGYTASFVVPDSILMREGPVSLTLHGWDQDGRHIVTTRGSVLTVEREG